MNAPSKDIQEILEDSSKGLSLVYGTDLFRTEMPEDPDFNVTIFDTGGFDEEAGYDYERPTIMIHCRGVEYGYDAAYAQMRQIRSALHGLHNETYNGTRYVGIWKMGDINPLGYDENNRPLLSMNFRIHRTTT